MLILEIICILTLVAVYSYLKKLRMTKQEVKEEYKQMEGDPQIKMRLRTIRMERLRIHNVRVRLLADDAPKVLSAFTGELVVPTRIVSIW